MYGNCQLRHVLRNGFNLPLNKRLQTVLFPNTKRVSFTFIPCQELTNVGSPIEIDQSINMTIFIPLNDFIGFTKWMTIVEISWGADQLPKHITRNIKRLFHRNWRVGLDVFHGVNTEAVQLNLCLKVCDIPCPMSFLQ